MIAECRRWTLQEPFARRGRLLRRTAFRYSHGREPAAGDACALDRLNRRFAATGGRILDLAVALTTDDSFVQRQIPQHFV